MKTVRLKINKTGDIKIVSEFTAKRLMEIKPNDYTIIGETFTPIVVTVENKKKDVAVENADDGIELKLNINQNHNERERRNRTKAS